MTNPVHPRSFNLSRTTTIITLGLTQPDPIHYTDNTCSLHIYLSLLLPTQLQQSPAIPMQLRALANSINLRFEDFSIMEGGRAVVIGRRAFHAAIWANQTPVTLSLTADCNQGVAGDLKQSSGAASGALNPIAEFFDLVPSNYLPLMPSVQVRMVQGKRSTAAEELMPATVN